MNNIEIVISLLLLKHFFVDFPFQTKYQWSNKGTYGHCGGLLHAFLHGIFTVACLHWFIGDVAFFIGLLDAVIHYHVDWIKMNLNTKMGWSATTHEEFWWLLGLDQLIHGLTYVGLLHIAMKYV